jgi:uncharacterized protein YbcC (UPF0753/DUF2309 family)
MPHFSEECSADVLKLGTTVIHALASMMYRSHDAHFKTTYHFALCTMLAILQICME